MFLIFFVLAFTFLILTSLSKPNSILNNNYNSKAVLFLFLITITINIVGREVVSDTTQYVRWFKGMQGLDWETARYFYPTDLLFFSIEWLLSRITDSHIILLLVIWLAFLIPFLMFLKKILTPWQINLVFFSYLCFGFFYSYTTIALRQGIALAFIFLALSLYLTNAKHKKIKIIGLSIIASLFHWTAVPFALIILLFSFKNIKLSTLLSVWFIFLFVYLFDLQQTLLKPILNYIPYLEEYSSTSVFQRYTGGANRVDFLIFSAFWIVLSLIFYKYLLNKEHKYLKMIKVYISFNTIYLMLGFIAFSDRIAGYSWMLIPLLIWYPISYSGKYRTLYASAALILSLAIGIISGSLDYLIPFNNVTALTRF